MPQFEYVEDEDEYPIYQIRKKIFAWINDGDYKTLMWENLETGECGKILVDSDIKKFLILNDAIIIRTNSEFIRDEFGKQRIKYRFRSYLSWQTKLIEGKDEIYIIDDDNIYAIGKALDHVRKIEYEVPDEDDEDYDFSVIEYIETEGLVLYLCQETGFLTSLFTEENYRKFTEKNPKGCSGKAPGPSSYSFDIDEDNSILFGINTKNYRLIQQSILSKDWENEICGFERMYNDETEEYGDVYVVEDKDIFISVCGTYYDNLIKIDLRNERKPVTLSVQML